MESIHPFHYFAHYKINIFCKSVMNLAGRKNVLGGPRVGTPALHDHVINGNKLSIHNPYKNVTCPIAPTVLLVRDLVCSPKRGWLGGNVGSIVQ
jgi:hypothetical protein